jgi:phage baseplate assembly protein W
LLGRGLRCDTVVDLGRDLRLRRTNAGLLDLDFVEGVDNLAQGLAIAVTTPLGGDVFNVDFGFDGLNALADEQLPVLQRERIRVAIVTLLRKDPRVARIVDVKLLDSRLEAPAASASRELEVRVVFETLTSDRLALIAGTAGAGLTNG